MKNKLFVLTVCLAIPVLASGRTTLFRERSVVDACPEHALGALCEHVAEIPDSIPEDESMLENDTITKTRENKTGGKGIDAMKYLLEQRYLSKGETFQDGTIFTKRWNDHLFVEAGLGFEQMVPPSGLQNYSFNALTTAHVGVGKQFNKLHSARLTLNGAFGYQQSKDFFFYKMGLKADHLFSISSYINGYDPTRLLDVSTVVGLGAQYAKLGGSHARSGTAFEAHLGLQLRFFTGPQGYLNIEPYYGLATDAMDLSEYRNWRKIDMFYGANVNFIYYLNNNLSPEARRRFIRNRSAANGLTPSDSLKLQSWRQPWFFEAGNGISFVNSPTLGLTETMGHEMVMSAGKWLSPVIGVRLSAATTSATWLKTVTPMEASPYHPEYNNEYRCLYFGARAEAMINPFGFFSYKRKKDEFGVQSGNYNWDSNFGAYLIVGGGIGRVKKWQNGKHLACRTQSYSGGVHLWMRLTNGLQFFVEPRYNHYVYKIPYSNVDWNKRFSDNGYSINMGFTVLTRGTSFRNVSAENEAAAADGADNRSIVVGLGGGVNLVQTKTGYEGGTGFSYNGQVFGEYHFNRLSAARLSFDYVSLSRTGMTSFIDYNMDNAADGYTPVKRSGLWEHRYSIGLISADYMVNLTTLFDGYRSGRLFEFSAFAGPTCAIVFGETGTLDSNERLQEGHEVSLADDAASGTSFGFNGGLKLTANVLPRLSVVFTPTIYVVGGLELAGLDMPKVKFLETLNLGVQYRF